MNEKNSGKKVKGSVLYTVISVMMVMTVLVFAALTLAASAHRRAANSYANNQTQYTARSVIDTICEAMQSNPEFSSQFASLESEGQAIEVAVELPGGDKSMGTIVGNPTITLLGTGTEYGYNSSKNMYKISATVKMSGQENTVAGYFLAEKVDNSMPFNYALVALESTSGADNMGVMGGASVGVNGVSNWQIRNQNAAIQSPVNVNGGVTVSANAYLLLSRESEGIYIGDYLRFDNAGHQIQSDLNLDKNNNNIIDYDEMINYKSLPYIYVEKNINFGDRFRFASKENPVIVMADSITFQDKASYIFGDVYLYAQHDPLTSIFLSATDAGVRSWDEGFVKKIDNHTGLSYTGGNIYSLGKLDIWCGSGNVGNQYPLANNVLADSVNLRASATTEGCIVADSINIQNTAVDATFEDGLYVDPDNLIHTNSIDSSPVYEFKINGHKYTPPVLESRDVNLLTQQYNGVTDEESSKKPIDLRCSTYQLMNFDFSDYVPEGTDKRTLTPLSITISLSKNQRYDPMKDEYVDEHYFGDSVKAYIDFYSYNEAGGYYEGYSSGSVSADIMINGETTINISDLNLNYTKGQIKVKFWRGEYLDENKYIVVDPITADFQLKADKIEYYIASQMDNRDYLRTVNDYAFNENDNVICIDDIDKSVKLEKYEDGFGGYELKISKADLTAIEEGEETDSNSVTYTEIGTYDYENLDSYADFLRAVVDTVTFPDSMKKVEKPDTKPRVYAPEIVDVSFLEWTSYEDVSKNSVAVSKQEYEAKIQADKAFDHISETENLVYDFSIGNGQMNIYEGGLLKEEKVTVAGYEVTSSCTFKGFMNKAIRISPSAENIYIKIGEYCNFGQTTIIVDDDNGKKKVNFLLEGGTEFQTQAVLMTKTYEEMYNAGMFDVIQNPSEQKHIPGVFFFAEYDKSSDTKITISNDAVITGYIMAPTAYLDVTKPLGKSYKYVTNRLYLDNDAYGNTAISSSTISEIEKSGIAVIGGIIAEKTSLANNPGCLYVNPNALLEVKGQKEMTLNDYDCLYYQAY